MPITRVGTASVAVAASSSSITPPTVAGTTAGDVIICTAAQGRPLSSFTNATYAGWTTLVNETTANGNLHTQVIYRVANGTTADNPPTMAYGTNTSASVALTAVYRGVDTAAPFSAQGHAAHAPSGATIFAPALANASAASWAVYFGAFRGKASPATWLADAPLIEHLDTEAGLGSSNNTANLWADTNGPAATGTVTYSGTASVTVNTDNGRAWAGILAPANPGGVASPGHIDNPPEIYAPAVGGVLRASPDAIPGAPVMQQPAVVLPGELQPETISPGHLVYAPSARTQVAVAPGFIADASAIYAPAGGNVLTLSPDRIATTGFGSDPLGSGPLGQLGDDVYTPAVSTSASVVPSAFVVGPDVYPPALVPGGTRDVQLSITVAARRLAIKAAARRLAATVET